MTIKYWFDLAYTALVVVALVIVGWSATHKVESSKLEAKSKIFGDIKAVAAAFVHYYNSTDMNGAQKMQGVIESTAIVLNDRGYKIDSSIKNLIEAFAQQYFDEHVKQVEAPKEETKDVKNG